MPKPVPHTLILTPPIHSATLALCRLANDALHTAAPCRASRLSSRAASSWAGRSVKVAQTRPQPERRSATAAVTTPAHVSKTRTWRGGRGEGEGGGRVGGREGRFNWWGERGGEGEWVRGGKARLAQMLIPASSLYLPLSAFFVFPPACYTPAFLLRLHVTYATSIILLGSHLKALFRVHDPPPLPSLHS